MTTLNQKALYKCAKNPGLPQNVFIGKKLATNDQMCLYQAAMDFVRAMTRFSEGYDLNKKIVAQARRDSKGNPWTAYIFSNNDTGTDLRYVESSGIHSQHKNGAKETKKLSDLQKRRHVLEEKLKAINEKIAGMKSSSIPKHSPKIYQNMMKGKATRRNPDSEYSEHES